MKVLGSHGRINVPISVIFQQPELFSSSFRDTSGTKTRGIFQPGTANMMSVDHV